MRRVSVLEAKTHLSSLLSEVEQGGGEIVITRHGRPVGMLSAAKDNVGSVDDFAKRVRHTRERIAEHWNHGEPFDWKAAVNEGRE